jgi:two-component system, cell cycle response regulator CpdR
MVNLRVSQDEFHLHKKFITRYFEKLRIAAKVHSKTCRVDCNVSHRGNFDPMARVLLTEDDNSVRHFLARSLELAGHEVLAFADGEDALPALDAGPFDILVTDIVMPRLGGLELAQKAKKISPSLPVIYITGFAAVSVEEGLGTGNINQLLSKPFHLNSLVEAVDRALPSVEAS